MTKDWFTGQWPDYGVMIKYVNDASAAPDIHFQYDDPMFTVSWVHQSGMHDPYSFESFSIGEDRQAMVNLVSGSLQLTETDLALAGTGVDASVSRTYDSREPQPGSMKAGWAMWPQTRERIYELVNGDLYWMGGPHGSLIFPRNPDGTYESPQGFAASMVKVVDGAEHAYVLSMHQSNLEYVFGTGGYPVWISDRTEQNYVRFYYREVAGNWVLSDMVDTKGRVTTIEHLNFTQVTKLTDPAGRVHRYSYDAGNQFLTSYTDPAGKVTRYEYLDDPMPPIPAIDKIIDPNGNETRFSYEPASAHYDPLPSGATLFDHGYRLTSLTRVTNKTAGTGPTWGFNYIDGQTTVTDPNGHQSIYRFDELGRTTEIEDHLGGKVATTYNGDGFVTSITDPAGKTTQYRRDASNNVDKTTLPTGVIRTGEYLDTANAHYPTMVRNAQGKFVNFAYNGAGHMTGSTNQLPANNLALAEYNTDGTVSKTTDGMGNVTTYSYFANGDLKQISRPLGVGNQSFTYDGLSRLKTATDSKGQTTTYTYDVMDRPTRIDFAGGDYVVNVYDAGGRLTRRDNVTGGQLTTTTFGYDALNRQKTRTVQGVTYTSTYDGVGNLDTLTDPNGTVDYDYDAADRLIKLTEPGGATTTFGYDGAYRRNLISYPNGVTQNTVYDETGKVTSIVGAKADGTVLTSFSYDYQDPDTLLKTDLVQVMTDPAGQTDYDYDEVDRLTQATGPHGNFSYTYDGNGNRLTQDVDGQVTNYMHNAADQLCYLAPTQGQSCGTAPAGATAFDYDPNGNLTAQSDGRSLAYNSKDQNTSFTPSGGAAEIMAYLDTGQAERTQAGSATFSTGPLGLASATEAGLLTTYYVRDNSDNLIGRNDLGVTHYYLFDRLGSVVAVTDALGNAVNTYVYDPYGNHLSGTSELIDNPWQFAGGFKDDFSGYYKFGARYYDPEIGRWTQPDPSGMEANTYAYAAGNPVNLVDPTGQFSCENNRFCRGAREVGGKAWNGTKSASSLVGRCIVDYGTCATNMTVALFPIVPITTGATFVAGGGAICYFSGGLACFAGANLIASGAGAVWGGAVLAERCWFSEERAECYQPLLEQ